MRRWCHTSPAYRPYKRAQNMRLYGLTEQDYQRLFDAQGGTCAICERPETYMRHGKVVRLAVDHDHVTNQRRGLVCRACNMAIGMFRESPAILERAAQYLKRHNPDLKLVGQGG